MPTQLEQLIQRSAERNQREAKKRRQEMTATDKLKKVSFYIMVGVFWIAVAFTFLGGCIGTFFKSTDEPQDDYEEYFHSTIP